MNIKKVVLWVLVMLGVSHMVVADFVVVQRAANPYLLKSESVYDLNIISSENQSVTVKLFGAIRKEGREVVQLESRPVAINPGANALSSFNVSSQRKNYLNKNILEIEQLTTTLPPGNYEICVYLRCATPDCSGLGRTPFDAEAVYCQQVKVEPPTPLLLSYPEDGAKLKIKKPTLSYIPPGPIAASSKLSYTVTLVKLNKGQHKVDGVKRNRPLLRKTGHSLTSLMYPLDLADLEVGERYAWQVEAWVGDQWISTSEVWEFSIEEEKEEQDSVDISYVLINNNKDIHQFSGELHFIYKEHHKEGPVPYKLTNEKGKEILMSTDTLGSDFGENKYTLDLRAYPEIRDGYYELTVFDKANKAHILRFKYTYRR